MVKEISQLSINRQKKRASIQLYYENNPNAKDADIAKLYNVSNKTVSKWNRRKYFTDKVRERKTKMNNKIKRFLITRAKNKFTGIENASCRKLSEQIKNKFNINISKTTVNNWLNQILSKPKKARKTFLLRQKDKNKRIEFTKYIDDNKIDGKQIFFTTKKDSS